MMQVTVFTICYPRCQRHQSIWPRRHFASFWWWTKSRCDSVCLRSRRFVAWHRPGLAHACPPRATLATTASARTQKTSKTSVISLFITMKQPHHTRNRLLALLVVDEVALRLRLPAEQALCGMASPGARACLPTSRNPCDHSQCPNPKNIKNPRNITFYHHETTPHTRNQLLVLLVVDEVALRLRLPAEQALCGLASPGARACLPTSRNPCDHSQCPNPKNIKNPRNITFYHHETTPHTRNRLLVLLVVDEVALRLRLPAEQALCGLASPGARACLPTSRNPCDHSQCPNPKNIKNPRNITFYHHETTPHTRNQLLALLVVDEVALRLRLPAEQALCGLASPGARACLPTSRNPCDHSQCPNPKNIKNPRNITYITMKQHLMPETMSAFHSLRHGLLRMMGGYTQRSHFPPFAHKTP